MCHDKYIECSGEYGVALFCGIWYAFVDNQIWSTPDLLYANGVSPSGENVIMYFDNFDMDHPVKVVAEGDMQDV